MVGVFAPSPGSLLLMVMADLQVWVVCSPAFMRGLAGIPSASFITLHLAARPCSWLSILAGTSWGARTWPQAAMVSLKRDNTKETNTKFKKIDKEVRGFD